VWSDEITGPSPPSLALEHRDDRLHHLSITRDARLVLEEHILASWRIGEVSRVSGHDVAPRPERFKGPASLLYCLHPLRLRDRELKRQSRLVPALRDLALVHEGKIAESWDEAALTFQLAVTKAKWMQAVKKARGSFEPFGARRHIMARYTTDLPNAPRGQYVLFQYETSVSGDRQVVETVIPVL